MKSGTLPPGSLRHRSPFFFLALALCFLEGPSDPPQQNGTAGQVLHARADYDPDERVGLSQRRAGGSTTTHRTYSGPLFSPLPTTVFSADLHHHGSFSEGSASMESATTEVRNHGLDVLWWSDHDGYFTRDRLVSSFSFDTWTEPAHAGESWTPSYAGESQATKSFILRTSDEMAFHEAVMTAEEVYAGSGSLKMTCVNESFDLRELLYHFDSPNNRNKRPLGAEAGLNIAVLPKQLSMNARPVIQILLSLHDAGAGLPWEIYSLRYFVVTDSLLLPYREGTVYWIPVVCTANEWNVVTLPLTEDAIQGFSYVTGIDNSLYEIHLGVESSAGDTACVFYDDLHVTTGIAGDTLLNVQRMIMDSLEQRMPEVVQLQGLESRLKHTNVFGEFPELLNYDSIAIESGYMDSSGWISDFTGWQDYCSKYKVDRAHAQGQAVSYNHMFGTSSDSTGGPDPQEILDELLPHRAYGVDILEVGYRSRGGRDLDAHLWVWDELAKQGLYLVGVGVTDSHTMSPGVWSSRENNLVTWIYSDAPTRAALADGLRRGRVFFGDLTSFDGTMDITTSEGFVMGQVVVTDRQEAEVTIAINGLTSGDLVQTIWSGQLVNTFVADGPFFTQAETHPLGPDGEFLRVGARTGSGVEKVLSNPIYFTRQAPAEGISFLKAGIDLSGICSTFIDSFTISSATGQQVGEQVTVSIQGTGTGGTIILRYPEGILPDSVKFESLSGSWEMVDSLCVLHGLTGTGTIEISTGSPLSPPSVFRINAGGETFVTSIGTMFGSDVAYIPGGFGFLGGTAGSTRPRINETLEDSLYAWYREGLFSYVFDVSPATYNVTFHFMEPTIRRTGRRVFDVIVGGNVVLDNIDVYARTGNLRTAFDTTITLQSTDEHLSIDFQAINPRAKAIVSAIEVVSTMAKDSVPMREMSKPLTFHVGQNYPNPFNPQTTIRFVLPEDGHVELKVFDLLGREVKTIINSVEVRGSKVASWDGTDNDGRPVSSGLYLYRIRTKDSESVRKMLLLK